MEQHLLLIGISYRTAGVDIREKFALTQRCSPETWALPVGPMSDGTELRETLILSTCNRVEILVVGRGNNLSERCLARWADACGQSEDELARHTYRYDDVDAVRHLFSVASSLDSMVLGEPQILGQLKDAYRKAITAKMTGPVINRLLHKAFSVAKRVRTETEIASSAVSISYAAVELAKRIFGNMKDYKAMLIGAGEMAELAATHLLQAGLSELTVTNRTFSHAEKLARHFNGTSIPFDDMLTYLVETDIVISSTGAPGAILHAQDVRKILNLRRNKPMFFIDIAVPRDIDPDVNNLDNIYLYDIDDLKEVVEENKAKRKDEATRAGAIVNEETDNAVRWLNSLSLQPIIVDLMDHFDKLAEDELARTCKHMSDVTTETREAMRVMLQSFARKIAHNPLEYMKQAHERGEMDKLQLIRELFALDEPLRHRHCHHRTNV